MRAKIFEISGRVQGVGFRPTVAKIAEQLGLCGYVCNAPAGVEIAIAGERAEEFLPALKAALPPLAQISRCSERSEQMQLPPRFEIKKSPAAAALAGLELLPDFATCSACAAEIARPGSRRFFYPLAVCTNCGPRYSIIRALPYERERTSMAPFAMCAACAAEFGASDSRFFHAQPLSCPACAPKIYYCGEEIAAAGEQIAPAPGQSLAQKSAAYREMFRQITADIAAGEVVCLQGLGGFHLIADAQNPAAVGKIRALKNRPQKALALLCKDLAHAREIAHISAAEERLLTSPAAPIVLLRARGHWPQIARDRVGVMLAYTPILRLLFCFIRTPLVATSANAKGEPIAASAAEAAALCARVLAHERAIVSPLDDSLAQVVAGRSQLLRTARGYAPLTLRLREKVRAPLLALGADGKAAFALAFSDVAVLSPYFGSLANPAVCARFLAALRHICQIYALEFAAIACDLHPDYESTRICGQLAAGQGGAGQIAAGARVCRVQHHYAHALAVALEHGLGGSALAFCFDGAGFGADGAIWGGEVLHIYKDSAAETAETAAGEGFKRLYHFANFRQLGGEAAVSDIARNVFALALAFAPEFAPAAEGLLLARGKTQTYVAALKTAYERGLNAPRSSSCARLIDAAAWLCGLDAAGYEGESGEFLQALYDENCCSAYDFALCGDEICLNWPEIFADAIAASAAETPAPETAAAAAPSENPLFLQKHSRKIASKFLNTLADVIAHIAAISGEKDVILCGGVFANRVISARAISALEARGKRVFLGEKVPPNDQAIALGQLNYLIKKERK